jgi:membrane fusion protein, copper/silver efflux system
LPGVKSADWYAEYNRLVCVYDTNAMSNLQIQKSIVALGHDTHDFRAKDDVYKSLPSCCKYERDPVFSSKSNLSMLEFAIEGMTCEDGCAKGIETNIFKIPGVKFSEVNYEKKRAKVIYNHTKVTKEQIQTAVETYKSIKDEQNVYKVVFLY